MRYLHLVIVFALIAPTTSRADVTVFDNEADFLVAAPIVGTLTFDNVPDLSVYEVLEAGNVRFWTNGAPWVVPGHCSVDRPLTAGNIMPRVIAFLSLGGRRGTVTAIGFQVSTVTLDPPIAANYGVAIRTEDGAVTHNAIIGVVEGMPAFRGFVSTSPIKSVVIRALGHTQVNFCLDDVSRTEIVPAAEAEATEPSVDKMDDWLLMNE